MDSVRRACVRGAALRPVLAGVAFFVACAGATWRLLATSASTAPAELAFVTSLQGITAPCGCTSRPLGGLDLLAAAVEAERQRGSVGLVAVGPTFFDPSPHSVGLAGHRQATARIIADVLAPLKPDAVFVTPAERQEGRDAPPWSSAQLPTTPVTDDSLLVSRIVKLGEHRVGLLAAAPSDAPVFSAASLSQAAMALKETGCGGVVVAFAGEAHQARRQLSEVRGIDLIVAESQGGLIEPELCGSAMLVDAGARGEHLGVMGLHTSGGSASTWQWDDGGEAMRRPHQAQRARFAREAAQLPDGPGKQARLTRVHALDEKLRQLVAAPIDGVSLTWRLVALDVDGPKAPWASAALLRYNDGLCDMAMAETAARTCEAAPREQERYVGSAACQACHASAYDAWQQSKHAHAWATLEAVHKTCDVTCVGCHVVGWERPGGFCHLADHAPYQNVGCENCHGPGAGHIASPTERSEWSASFVRDTPEATCRSCHNAEHSDQFEFARYRAQVVVPGHGLPLTAPPG